MNIALILPSYFLWHYTTALVDIMRISGNFLWFLNNLFSISLLFRTLLSPWKRIHEEKRPGLHIEEDAERFILNMVMRGVGIVVRIFFIIVGLIACLVVLILEVLAIVLWLLLPGILVFLVFSAFKQFTAYL